MARKNMSVARVEKLSAAKIGKAERHNERKNESYANLNVEPERIPFNVSFKSTDGLTYDDGFYCFGCHEHGDVIDFVSKLFGLDAKGAAEKLAADFGIGDISFCPAKPVQFEKSDDEKNREQLNESWAVLCDYLHLLWCWKDQYLPDRKDENWHPLFCEALQNTDRVEYLLDCIWDCQASEAPALLEQIGGEIDRYRTRIEQERGSEIHGRK